ncbi:MAG: right-handed parallel beta-helix repeat-containing protein [Candidatus Heimdallarchaeota archaeon]
MVTRNVKTTIVVISVLAIAVVPTYFIVDYFVNSFVVIDELLTAEILINKDNDFKRHSIEGTGSKEDPYIIANYNFNSRKDCGIVVLNTNAYFKIVNCSISVKRYGIYIDTIFTNTCQIINNNIFIKNENNGWEYHACMKILDAANLTITQNTCSFLKTTHPISSELIRAINLVRCDDSLIEDNYIFDSGRGIATVWSDNCQIKNNILINCTHYAIHLNKLSQTFVFNNTISNSGFGIYTLSVGFNIVQNNTFAYNNLGNAYFAGRGSFLICFNLFQIDQGIQIEFWNNEDSSSIHHNNFMIIGDYLEPYNSQAIDQYNQTVWYDPITLEGNYWSDFEWNPGLSYQIAGNGNNSDLYPLETPVTF